MPLEDLIQQGCLGLLKAAARFDPDHGCRLVTYAAFWIRAEIREYVLRGHRMVRIGTTKGERKAVRLFRRTGELDPGRLAAQSGLPLERVERLLPMLASRDVSLDDASTFGTAPVERMAADMPTPEEGVADREVEQQTQTAIRELLSTLAPREQVIVRMRWLEETPATLEQLGAEFGISKERVRQLEQRVRERLRVRLERRQRLLLAS
jgi:RNA polymerase sigma-32 factor